MFKLEMSKLSDLFGRQEEMSIIINLINNNRLVTIFGIPGIGKTTIAKGVGLYIEERSREKFSDGILYISMNKKFHANMLISQLYNTIKKKLSQDELHNLINTAKLMANQHNHVDPKPDVSKT